MKPQDVTDWQEQWRDVRFDDDVEVVRIERGRSAAHFIANSTLSDEEYTIFMSDFLDMAIGGDVKGTKICGLFKVVKKGENLGIRLVDTASRKRNNDDIDWTKIKRTIPAYI